MITFCGQFRKFLTLLALMIAGLSTCSAATYSIDEVPNVHVANRDRFVSDPDGVLSPATISALDSRLRSLRDSTTAEAVVVVVGDVEGYDPDRFATKLFEEWGLGKKDTDNGLLMLVVMDQRKVVIRTGRGLEGPLPDVACGRIIRNVIRPAFRADDYDGGISRAVDMMAAVIADPANAGDILSSLPDADYHPSAQGEELSLDSLLRFMAGAGCVMAVAILVILFVIARSSKNRTMPERWGSLTTLSNVGLFLSFLGLGIPLAGYIPTRLYMRRLRNRHAPCPNCGARMNRLDEQTDNQYLTQAQDTEERINSIDYDVWLCSDCGTTDVIPFVNRTSSYSICDVCGAKACTLARDQVIVRPTERREGEGEKTFVCLNCHNATRRRYRIAKLAAPIVIIGGGGGFGGGGGGGSFGGGFGGGMTSGGGASGGW